MLPRERVQAAFDHQPSDKVPIYQAGFSSWAGSIVLGREAYVGGGIQQYREARALWEGPDAHAEYIERSRQDAFDIADVLDLDLIRPSYWRMNEKPTKRLDEHTFFYGDENGTWRVMRFNPQTELYQVAARSPRPELTMDDLERSVAGDPPSADAYKPTPASWPDLTAAVERFPNRAIPGFGTGLCIPRETIWLEACVLRPDLVGKYLDRQLAHVPGNVAVMKEIGLKYLCGGGDFAGPLGPLYSPRVFHDLMAPRLKRITEICHEHGCYHGFASDGNLWPVAEDLFGYAEVDFFYELDRRAGMDLARLRQTFPHLTLWGGINSQTLHQGTVEDVRVETLTALEAAQEHTSMVIGCSNQIVAGTPPENIEAMLETMREHR
ncbi:uroporphyrinogen decarboxylase family protein [bacterium]|nr:uroporphyrinogen decarboxylase family protein [bacterium]